MHALTAGISRQRLHEAEKTDMLHHLPLILVALPPLGAIVHG